MTIWRVTAKCANGHSQHVDLADARTRESAETFAMLMDGSFDPEMNARIRKLNDPELLVGRCSIEGCGAFFDCTVTEVFPEKA